MLSDELVSVVKTDDVEKMLSEASIDVNADISRPPTILSIQEQSGTQIVHKRIFSLGNFSCIIGKAKTKKTFLVGMLTAACLKKDDTAKLIGDLPDNKKTVYYFDTEQGLYDSQFCIRRVAKMSGNITDLRAYNLRPYTPLQRCQVIEYAFEQYGDQIGYCVIDGIADLATGINDEVEATRVASLLLRLTKTYNCHISTVIHQNKNDNFATGHLGSMVMKKCEIIISVSKISGNYASADVKCDLSRAIDFEPFVMTINNDGIPEISEKFERPKPTSDYSNIYESISDREEPIDHPEPTF